MNHPKSFARSQEYVCTRKKGVATTISTAYALLFGSMSCVVNVDIEPIEKDLKEDSARPSCSYRPEDFQDGLLGFCQSTDWGTNTSMHLHYIDLSGNEVFQFEWTSSAHVDNEPLNCTSLCRAGAWEIAYSGDRLQPRQRQSVFNPSPQVRTCSIVPNAEQDYSTCDERFFSCVGQCGIGCRGCTQNIGEQCSNDSDCLRYTFQCYTRPCCIDHHVCLQSSESFEQRIQCHVKAEQQGCGISDLRGLSFEEEDAQCSPVISACISAPATSK